MSRLPFLKFYPNDHLAEPTLRMCSLAARGLWMEMLSLMHLSARRGYLLAASGTPLSPEQLARMTGCSAEEVSRLLAELQSSGVFSCTPDGTIYSRRMVRDESKRERCGEAGRRGGGNPALRRGAGGGEPGGTTDTFKGAPKGGSKGAPKGRVKPPEARGHLTSSSKKCAVFDPAAGEPEEPDEPLEPGPGKGAKKSPPNPNHAPAVASFCAAWEQKYGTKYPFARGKDAALVAETLAAVGNDLEQFRALVARYLADDESFAAGNGHDLGTLRLKLPRWLAPAPGAPRARAGFRPPPDFDTQPPREAA